MRNIQERFRSALQTKIFDRLGKVVTFKKKSSPIYNDRGEELSASYSSSDIVIVPYTITDKERSFQQSGNLTEGTMFAAVPYTVDIAEDDLLTIEGEDWVVRSVEKHYVPDNAASIVRIVRAHS